MSRIEKWEAPKLWKYDENNEPSTNSGVVVVVTYEAHRKREEEICIGLLACLDSLSQYKQPCELLWGLGGCADDGWANMDAFTKAAIRSAIVSWFEARALLDAAKEEKHGTD